MTMKHITLTIESDFHDKVKDYIKDNGMKLSSLVRTLLQKEILRNETIIENEKNNNNN